MPSPIRVKYFSFRSRYIQLFTLVALIGSGFVLEWGRSVGQIRVFALLFALAGIFRLLGAAILMSQSESSTLAQDIQLIPFRKTLKILSTRKLTGLFFFLVFLQFAVNVSGPFFTPFMLEQLKMSYTSYSLLIAAPFLVKFMALPLFSELGKSKGTSFLISFGTIGVIAVPALWLMNGSFIYLFCLQIATGFFWASYELGAFLIFFETLRTNERASFLSTYNLLSVVGMVTGVLIGGYLLKTFGESWRAYAIVFVTSSLMRVVATLGLPKANEHRLRRSHAVADLD